MRVWYWRLPESHAQNFDDLIHLLAYFGSFNPQQDQHTVDLEWQQLVDELLTIVGNGDISEEERLPALLRWAHDFLDVSMLSISHSTTLPC